MFKLFCKKEKKVRQDHQQYMFKDVNSSWVKAVIFTPNSIVVVTRKSSIFELFSLSSDEKTSVRHSLINNTISVGKTLQPLLRIRNDEGYLKQDALFN